MKVAITPNGVVYDVPDPSVNLYRLLTGEFRVVETQPLPPMPALTVAEVISRLGQYPANMRVLIEANDWYHEVSGVEGPKPEPEDPMNWTDEGTGFCLPTLMLGEGFDSRSL